jgi:hypothetical protein
MLMLGFFLPFALKLVGPKWAKLVSILLAIVSVIAALFAIWGAVKLIVHRHDSKVVSAYENKVDAQVNAQAAVANTNLQARAAADNASIAAQRQEFDNATANIPPSGLTARQRVDACRELRDEGTDKALLARAGCL